MSTKAVFIFTMFFTLNVWAGPSWELRFLGHGDGYRVEQISSSKIVGQVKGFGVTEKSKTIVLKRNILGQWSGQFGDRTVRSRPAIGGVKSCYSGKKDCYTFHFNNAMSGDSIVGSSEDKSRLVIAGAYIGSQGRREINFRVEESPSGREIANLSLIQQEDGDFNGIITKSSKVLPAIVTLKLQDPLAEPKRHYFNLDKLEENFDLLSILLIGPLVF